MKAYLINPYDRTIKEVDYPGDGDINDIYKLLSTPEHPVDTFDVVRFNDLGDGIYVDDEGLFKGPQKFFQVTNYHTPLCGCGLVLGCDSEGSSVSPTVDMEWLRANVTMLSLLGVMDGMPLFMPAPLAP